MIVPEPLPAYLAACRDGRMKADSGQKEIATELQQLCKALSSNGFFVNNLARYFRIPHGLLPPGCRLPRGLYIYGPPGRGKSMLMDMFFESVQLEAKRRVHVYGFMQQVHKTLHNWRRQGRGNGMRDPLPRLARQIARDCRLLCFDEFQIEAVADAMILRRLFESLLDCGVVVVATSNTAPADLYASGLQRERFLPFIELIDERLDTLTLNGPLDYRTACLQAVGLYHTPINDHSEAALDDAFSGLTGGAAGTPNALMVHGRRLPVPCQAHGVARFAFSDLCEQPLGPADYLSIACRYQAIILSGIPRMEPHHRDEAHRFSILVESLYEQRTKLVCSAAVEPDQLFNAGDDSETFRRVVSRLREMQSEGYVALSHRPSASVEL